MKLDDRLNDGLIKNFIIELNNDLDFQVINNQLDYKKNPDLEDAYINYNEEEWSPVLIKNRNSGKIGFEINPLGVWGNQEITHKLNLTLVEFLAFYIFGYFPTQSHIRCRVEKLRTRDGRILANIKFEGALKKLILKYQMQKDIVVKVSSSILLFSEDEKLEVKKEIEQIGASLEGFDGKEKDSIVNIRVNQGLFRKLMIDYWNVCAVSGLSDARLLIASHILPWSKATNHQKGDLYNGLLLSVVWDSFFDRGLISFKDNGEAILYKLNDELLDHFGLRNNTYSISQTKISSEHQQYLRMHRILHGYE